MEKLSQSRLASLLTLIVGAWMMLTPLAISMTGAALTSILITGAIIIVASLVQLGWMNTLPSWVNALAAVWLFISAFAFTMGTGAAWNQAIFAVITFVLAAWDGVEMGEVHRGQQMHA
ncbi:MAG TPA: hypothetical protein VN778_04790 [Verrucomicrobiae bacterium]|nr:hypothetical protein [Verrucomicrobiae bacterium]